MANSKPASIVRKRYAKIDKALKRVVPGFAPEDIHQFRLQVKKLRSYLGLVATVKQKGIWLKLPTKLHQFYIAIGAVRNLQLQQQRISPLFNERFSPVLTPYLHFISASMDNAVARAKKLARRKKNFAKERDKLVKQLPSKLRPATSRKFIRHRIDKLKALMQPSSLSDESLHFVRKLLKDILYTWPYTTKKNSGIPEQELMSREEIDSIIKVLGSFRDKCEGLDLLHVHYKQQQSGSNQRLMWRRLENTWWHERELERVSIHHLFHKEFALLLHAEQFHEHALPLPVKQLTLLKRSSSIKVLEDKPDK